MSSHFSKIRKIIKSRGYIIFIISKETALHIYILVSCFRMLIQFPYIGHIFICMRFYMLFNFIVHHHAPPFHAKSSQGNCPTACCSCLFCSVLFVVSIDARFDLVIDHDASGTLFIIQTFNNLRHADNGCCIEAVQFLDLV